jgi:hypothetical protein
MACANKGGESAAELAMRSVQIYDGFIQLEERSAAIYLELSVVSFLTGI